MPDPIRPAATTPPAPRLAHGGAALVENLSPHGSRVSVVMPVQPPG